MNNKENFKRAFAVVRTSEDYCKGVYEMNRTFSRKLYMSRVLAVCLILCVAFGAAGACYAADVGGIQRQVQIWIMGDQTDAVIEFNGNGGYNMEYTDVEGNKVSQSGGGVAYDAFGNERPATEEELMNELNAPNVRYGEDGKVTLYYYGQAEDITDMFEDGVCYIKLVHDGEPLYLTIKYQKGYACNSKKFVSADEFNMNE